MAIQTLHDTGSGNAVTPKMDGGVYQVSSQDCVIGGVGDEFTIQYSVDSLNVSFNAGSEAVLCGAYFTTTSLEAVTLTANTTIYLCANIDLSKPNGSRGSFVERTQYNMQSDNLNGSGSSRDLLLYIVTTGASGVTNVVDKRRIVDVGGRNYLSGNFINITDGYINGKIGIDANNLIHSVNGYIPESTPWTATQDCWCLVRYYGGTIHISVDGLRVVSGRSSGTTSLSSLDAGNMAFPIKKGQSVAVYQTGNHSDTGAAVKFYGVK